MCKRISLSSLKKRYHQNVFTNPIHFIYMYKEELALNNLQWLICHEIQLNQTINALIRIG